MKYLLRFRKPQKGGSTQHKFYISALIFLLGAGMGALSKWLDTIPYNELPGFMQGLDLANLFGRVAVWALVALAVAVFGRSPLRAAINACVYFAGVVVSYCLCSVWLAGFMLDTSYLMIWTAFTVLAFPLGFIVWYGRGRGWLATAVSAVVIAYYIRQAFAFDASFSYFGLLYGWFEVAFLVIAVAILYVRPKQTLISAAAGAALAYVTVLAGITIPYIL